MTVSIAVTNRASISTWRKVPTIAKKPTTTMTSWSSDTSAVTPNLTSRNREVIHSRIRSEPTRMRTSAWVMRSLLTTAPIVVRLRCSAIGPSSCWSAVATAPRVPCVGSWVLPETTGGVDGDALGEGEPPAAADALGAGDALGLALALALGAGEPLAGGEPLGAVEPLAAGEPVGAADGTTSRKSAVRSVLISMTPDPVVTAVASSP